MYAQAKVQPLRIYSRYQVGIALLATQGMWTSPTCTAASPLINTLDNNTAGVTYGASWFSGLP